MQSGPPFVGERLSGQRPFNYKNIKLHELLIKILFELQAVQLSGKLEHSEQL